ncbi:substrate-binding periplasmic protein [Rhizobium halophytocola]|uniref:ABC-type amino acid transport substrate-binding protein n=1 Tax=Rhizobium halophytocola TaxID=735519 RepID=A0ABS4DUI0_9HYPH|nr:transporter substrate-binding domain-containing protein [Rhizobium halophytocola]MBP1849358.1 ABC-type amino acid transport substrate-binding protein [Rhizobium halophytocola]
MRMNFKTTAATIALGLGIAMSGAAAHADGIDLDKLDIHLEAPKPWPLANLVEAGKLTMVTTAKTPKETFIGDDGNLQGARIDLWTKMAGDLGLEPNFVKSDWAGVMPGLAANRFDLGCEGASWTNERLTSKDFFLTRPVKVQVNVAVVRKDSGIASFDDMKDKKVGGVKGEIELKSLLTKLDESEDSALALPGVAEARLALLNHQIDVYGTGLHAATSVLDGPDGDQFMIIPTPTSVGVGGFCVNGREPDLLVAVNFLMAKYRADGTIKELNEKWGLPDTSDLLAKLGY